MLHTIKQVIAFRFILATLSLAILFQAGCDISSNSGGMRTADYTDFYLRSNMPVGRSNLEGEEFFVLVTDVATYKTLPEIYIELPDQKRYLLKDLPESEVAKFFIKNTGLPEGLGSGNKYNDSDYKYNNESYTICFWFRDGKLMGTTFTSSDSIPILFSPTKEGPYYTLPITYEKMVELFGEPVKWGSYRSGNPRG